VAEFSTGPLISVADLAVLLGSDAPPAVLDVRWKLAGPPGAEAYRAGHLPGAVYVDLDEELAGPPGSGAGGRHPLPEPADFQAAMRAAGLRDDQLAVVYDDVGSTVAARLWWLLRYFGHDQVAVLDGGLAAWTAAGLPVTGAFPRPAAGNFAAGRGGGMPVLDEASAARLATSGLLLDARAGERYRGEVEPVDPAAGHIPGALSAPAAGNLAADGTFLPPAELRDRFAGLGLRPGHGAPAAGSMAADNVAGDSVAGDNVAGDNVAGNSMAGAYCGSGVTAAQEVLALELAGLRAALYVGSWSAWSADPARPVATGPDPG
jgi:thiosulfate/3-mercaptopyruvate sulfurtransferase